MIRAALLLALTTLAAAQNGAATTGRLDTKCYPALISQTKNCLDAYFRGYGLNPDSLPPFSDYVKLIVDMTTNYGAKGVDIFCSFEVTVENCLGDLFTSPCMTAGTFQEMYGMSMASEFQHFCCDLSWADSLEYSTDFQMRAYMCANKQFMIQNLDCFNDVVTKHEDERQKCTTDVEKAIGDVTDGDYCKPWGPFITCTDNVYVKYCGQNVKGYICGVLEAGINFDSKEACTQSLPKC